MRFPGIGTQLLRLSSLRPPFAVAFNLKGSACTRMASEVPTDVREKETIAFWERFLPRLDGAQIGLQDCADPLRRRTLRRLENTLSYLRVRVGESFTECGKESVLDGSDRSITCPHRTPGEGGRRKLGERGRSLRSLASCGGGSLSLQAFLVA